MKMGARSRLVEKLAAWKSNSISTITSGLSIAAD